MSDTAERQDRLEHVYVQCLTSSLDKLINSIEAIVDAVMQRVPEEPKEGSSK